MEATADPENDAVMFDDAVSVRHHLLVTCTIIYITSQTKPNRDHV